MDLNLDLVMSMPRINIHSIGLPIIYVKMDLVLLETMQNWKRYKKIT